MRLFINRVSAILLLVFLVQSAACGDRCGRLSSDVIVAQHIYRYLASDLLRSTIQMTSKNHVVLETGAGTALMRSLSSPSELRIVRVFEVHPGFSKIEISWRLEQAGGLWSRDVALEMSVLASLDPAAHREMTMLLNERCASWRRM